MPSRTSVYFCQHSNYIGPISVVTAQSSHLHISAVSTSTIISGCHTDCNSIIQSFNYIWIILWEHKSQLLFTRISATLKDPNIILFGLLIRVANWGTHIFSMSLFLLISGKFSCPHVTVMTKSSLTISLPGWWVIVFDWVHYFLDEFSCLWQIKPVDHIFCAEHMLWNVLWPDSICSDFFKLKRLWKSPHLFAKIHLFLNDNSSGT